MKNIKGKLSRGTTPFLKIYGINQKNATHKRGRMAAGATDEPPAKRENNGKLVIGNKIKTAAQAMTRER